MSTGMAKIVMWESKDGWRWRLVSRSNGKILASSEAYKSKRNCDNTVNKLVYHYDFEVDVIYKKEV